METFGQNKLLGHLNITPIVGKRGKPRHAPPKSLENDKMLAGITPSLCNAIDPAISTFLGYNYQHFTQYNKISGL